MEIIDKVDTSSEGITATQAKALEVLLLGGSVPQAATAIGVAKDTVYWWIRHDVGFKKALDEATGETIDAASRQMSGLLSRVLEQLAVRLDTEEMDISDLLRALDILARYTLQFRNQGDLEERIRHLEAIAEGGTR